MSRLVAAPPPNRVRSPTDRQFASGCSPRRFEPTQLPLASELWHTPARTFTVLMWRPHRRTHSAPLSGFHPRCKSDGVLGSIRVKFSRTRARHTSTKQLERLERSFFITTASLRLNHGVQAGRVERETCGGAVTLVCD